MTHDTTEPLSVSRRIPAAAAVIFGILADPARHADVDGTEMLQGSDSQPVRAVGDVFVMRMRSSKWGDYEVNNHVVEFEPDRLIAWEPHAASGHPHADLPRLGHRWTYELTPEGPDATVVTETYDCSRAPAEERANVSNGRLWLPAMEDSLARLEAAATRAGEPPA